MAAMPAEPGERLPGERVIFGGATVVLSMLPIGLLVAPAPLAVLVLRHGLASGIWRRSCRACLPPSSRKAR